MLFVINSYPSPYGCLVYPLFLYRVISFVSQFSSNEDPQWKIVMRIHIKLGGWRGSSERESGAKVRLGTEQGRTREPQGDGLRAGQGQSRKPKGGRPEGRANGQKHPCKVTRVLGQC